MRRNLGRGLNSRLLTLYLVPFVLGWRSLLQQQSLASRDKARSKLNIRKLVLHIPVSGLSVGL